MSGWTSGWTIGWFRFGPSLRLIGLVLMVWAICEAVNRAVEQPLGRLRRRLSHQRAPAATPPAPVAAPRLEPSPD